MAQDLKDSKLRSVLIHGYVRRFIHDVGHHLPFLATIMSYYNFIRFNLKLSNLKNMKFTKNFSIGNHIGNDKYPNGKYRLFIVDEIINKKSYIKHKYMLNIKLKKLGRNNGCGIFIGILSTKLINDYVKINSKNFCHSEFGYGVFCDGESLRLKNKGLDISVYQNKKTFKKNDIISIIVCFNESSKYGYLYFRINYVNESGISSFQIPNKNDYRVVISSRFSGNVFEIINDS